LAAKVPEPTGEATPALFDAFFFENTVPSTLISKAFRHSSEFFALHYARNFGAQEMHRSQAPNLVCTQSGK
jgi:hypothetical protein